MSTRLFDVRDTLETHLDRVHDHSPTIWIGVGECLGEDASDGFDDHLLCVIYENERPSVPVRVKSLVVMFRAAR